MQKGLQGQNDAAPIVMEYNSKKILATLGYRFTDEDLTPFDVECYTIIAAKLAELEERELKRNKKR